MQLEKYDLMFVLGIALNVIAIILWAYYQFSNPNFIILGAVFGLGLAGLGIWFVMHLEHRKIGKPLKAIGGAK
jgi:heme/copper-type cytochrome/quinol oxidase subunit 4